MSVRLEWVIRTLFPRERDLASRAPLLAVSSGSMRQARSTLSSHSARSTPHFLARPSVTNPSVIRTPRSPAFRATAYQGQFQEKASLPGLSGSFSRRSVSPGPQKFTYTSAAFRAAHSGSLDLPRSLLCFRSIVRHDESSSL